MKFLNYIKYINCLIILLICIGGLVCCTRDEGAYYEYFYDIELDKQNKFIFSVTPKSNKTYRVMLVLYPKNKQERDKAFNYAHMINTTRSHSLDTTYAIISIKNKYNEIIYNATSYLYLSAHDSEKLDFYLIRRAIKLEKNQDYTIEVEFKNLNQYPLSHIESRLAFGLGQYYEPSFFH